MGRKEVLDGLVPALLRSQFRSTALLAAQHLHVMIWFGGGVKNQGWISHTAGKKPINSGKILGMAASLRTSQSLPAFGEKTTAQWFCKQKLRRRQEHFPAYLTPDTEPGTFSMHNTETYLWQSLRGTCPGRNAKGGGT